MANRAWLAEPSRSQTSAAKGTRPDESHARLVVNFTRPLVRLGRELDLDVGDAFERVLGRYAATSGSLDDNASDGVCRYGG